MKADINNHLGAKTMDKLREIQRTGQSCLVQVPSEEHAFTLLIFLYEIGYRFGTPEKFDGKTRFEEYKDQTCYLLERSKQVTYAGLDYFNSQGQYKDLPIIKLS